MKTMRIAFAILLTLTVLYIARNSSRGRPEFISHTENGITFEMTTVPKGQEHEVTRIPITITGDLGPGLKPLYRQNKSGQDEKTSLHKYYSIPLQVEDSVAGLYYSDVLSGDRGKRLYYYFEIRDPVGGLRASFKKDGEQPFVLKFIGTVPGVVLYSHIVLMFAAVFFIVLGSLHAIGLIRGGTDARPMSLFFLFAAATIFVGCYPIGFAMNHYTFRTVWEGVPFGTDATDNKTQLLFVYILFMVAASFGSLLKGKWCRDVYSTRTLGWFGFGALVLSLFIYLIPHSIQFSPELTYAACYSFIGLVTLLYVAGLINSRKTAKSAIGRNKTTTRG